MLTCNIFMSHVNIIILHVNIIMLHVDIINLNVGSRSMPPFVSNRKNIHVIILVSTVPLTQYYTVLYRPKTEE